MQLLPFHKARVLLSNYTVQIALDIRTETGKLPRICQADAPDNFKDLCASWRDTELMTYAVASEGLAGSVYLPVAFGLGKVLPADTVNAYARYWHDYTHARYDLDFTHTGELSTAWHQVFTLALKMRQCNMQPQEVFSACALLWADTAGQALFFEQNAGAFVTDQLAFGADLYANIPEQALRRIKGVIADTIRIC